MLSKSYTTMSDQDLAQECVKSNPVAQKVLYERYYSRMLSLCLRYSDSKDDAKDSLHDGFILLFSKMELYSGKGSFEGWMRRLFVNNMLMKIRKKDIFRESVSVDDVTWNLPVKEDVFDKIRSKDVIKLISQMPQGYKVVFNMIVIEGYSYNEVAQELNISEVSVRSQLSRGRMWLRERILKLEDKQ
ncbi:MAG: sigma-70 family RNA polymerase sigma factor [Bacteroidales bacterium]|nr:sigma-70 family RNA polymerase sigma factor [Bacteroidales bacterium]MBQ5882779.1 sigma-70 family RNA polymerase sigma factor [Bacteroidales bacterium]